MDVYTDGFQNIVQQICQSKMFYLLAQWKWITLMWSFNPDQWTSPEHISDSQDAEGLVSHGSGPGGSAAGDDGAVAFNPDITSTLHHHPVLTADGLAL